MGAKKTSKASGKKRSKPKARVRKKLTRKKAQPDRDDPYRSELLTERLQRVAFALTHAHEGGSPVEMGSLLDSMMGRNVDDLAAGLTEPAERAQQFAYDAMESDNPAAIRRFIAQALELHPGCVEARRIRLLLQRDAELDKDEDAEDVASSWDLITLGEESATALQRSGILDENPGEAWRFVVARPWLRAMREAARTCVLVGESQRAMALASRMLDADEEDQLLVAGIGAASALALGDVENARAFVACLGAEPVAMYLHAIERFVSGDVRGAKRLLSDATVKDPEIIKALAEFVAGSGGAPADPALAQDVGLVLTSADSDDVANFLSPWFRAWAED